MKPFSLLILLLLTTAATMAQPSSVTIDATGEVQLPADLVIFEINITVTDPSPQTVFQKHKNRETALTDLIRDKGIEPENLRFQPMNIRATRTQREVVEYRSNQHVRLTLADFELFEGMQVYLIDNGFDSFSGQFSSTKLEEGEVKALELAMENARNKAEIIASSLALSIKGVSTVHHGAPPLSRGYANEQAMMRSDSSSLLEFDQNVRVSSSVTVTFELE
ncbi:MAG: SIMPL domain-containing protein [Balneolaceae bacterium]